ncbi:hypothetical protein [Halanaerobium sp. ST460_2HS_T2]|jgi:hypothetical protein|uniref:DUF7768 domain-containing protein n=1 Tax=Halanaerobium sp. ST460_2HS_T2 TaxID=2183914 RepID=UPI000DF129A7|nr:hypothetical protein DFR80_1488 [Halanaerobium sp. ST460_2HS_T2]
MNLKNVIILTPYKGESKENIRYAKLALLDSLLRGEAPFARHLLYTQVLDYNIPKEREVGIEAGISWYQKADLCAVYTDNGFSSDMREGIQRAKENDVEIELRSIDDKLDFNKARNKIDGLV